MIPKLGDHWQPFAKQARPPPRLNIWQWADAHRYLAKGISARSLRASVPYRTQDAPHQKAAQESMTDPAVQVTVLIMASQIGGKTEMINNAIGYHMHWKPTNAVVMYPTIESAEKYSKQKLMPMVRATPVLQGLIAPNRMRDSGNTILVKEFSGGSIFMVGANSPASLRQASGQLLIADEIDSYKDSAGIEGDPVELLWRRGESFPNVV
jgi:phage terminase large subunit GpA-like protein